MQALSTHDVMITTNQEFAERSIVPEDPKIAITVLDRLTHCCQIFEIGGASRTAIQYRHAREPACASKTDID